MNFSILKLSNSEMVIKVDSDKYDSLSKYDWRLSNIGYARATVEGHRMFLHRYLTNAPKGVLVDHINGDTLDNRLCNLRLCTYSENSANTMKKVGLSVYKGVSYDKNTKRKKRWMARLEYKGKNITIGRFYTEDEAALAYNEKAFELWGEFCVLNDIENKIQTRYKDIKNDK